MSKYFRYFLLEFLLFFLAGEKTLIDSPIFNFDREYASFQLDVNFADLNLEKAIRKKLDISDSAVLKDLYFR